MGWSWRKRKTLIPGVRLNFGKRGVSTTIGPRGASVTFGPNGTYLMTELKDMLQGIGLGAEVDDMCNAMRLIDDALIKLKKAKRDEEFCRIDPNYAFIARNPMGRKSMAVADIQRHMKTIDECLENIRESL